jgi:transketolase
MTVVVPADWNETWQAVFALGQMDGPCYMRLGREKFPNIFDDSYRFEIGKAATVREGGDVAIIACGCMTSFAMTAAEELAAEGIGARVINMSTIKPIDVEAIASAARDCGAIVTAEEHSVIGGLGGAVAEVVGDTYPVPMARIGVQDSFGHSGEPMKLFELFGMSAPHIAEACRKTIARKGK